MKAAIVDVRTLTKYDPQDELPLKVDASTNGLGACLMQEERPVSFASKSLTKTESNYSSIERESLTVVFGLEHFKIQKPLLWQEGFHQK